MDLAWTNRDLIKTKQELQACVNRDRTKVPNPTERYIAEQSVDEKVVNDVKISKDPDAFVGDDEVLTELDETSIGFNDFFLPNTIPLTNGNRKSLGQNLRKCCNPKTEQLNYQSVIPMGSPASQGDSLSAELKRTGRKIKLLEERDAARSKLRAIDEKCETGKTTLAKKSANNELRQKMKARLRAVKTAQSNKPDSSEW
ncbi:hypothetical protein OUZ56_002483 [Daphnia magna]|uniref:Uncharacterized protein n=1 Tax=Daphnia magna TaxID=35525 RepID=A0ABR0A6B1_9CRUS|nr:hypothetical protein OUZ56_002483 [Daphnia magna]